MNLVNICNTDKVIVDYDRDTKKYRISLFEDNHWQDEFWITSDTYNTLLETLSEDKWKEIEDKIIKKVSEAFGG